MKYLSLGGVFIGLLKFYHTVRQRQSDKGMRGEKNSPKIINNKKKSIKDTRSGGRKMNEAYSAYNIKNALRALAVDPRYSDEQIDAMYDLVAEITGLSTDSVIDAIYDDDEVIYADELCCY